MDITRSADRWNWRLWLPLLAGAVCSILSAAECWSAETEDDHPLAPVLEYAQQRLQEMDNEIKDYECILVRRERLAGRLSSYVHAQVKLRHQQTRGGVVQTPFSVYMRFLSPAEVEGREVLYVQGQNKGNLIVRRGGRRFKFVTVAVDPKSEIVLRESRYPIEELGIRNLTERLIEVGKEDLQHDEIEVAYFEDTKVNGRLCTAIQITHPVRRDYFRYHVARVFIDDELQIPIRYASYDWPRKEGGAPPLLEEYTYLDLELNVGLGNWDFDHRNDDYKFRGDFTP
jgi:Protein of unknown function (DUF1571)